MILTYWVDIHFSYFANRPVIKPSKPSRGSAWAWLSGLHAQFGLLGGPSWPLKLGSVQLNRTEQRGCLCLTEHARRSHIPGFWLANHACSTYKACRNVSWSAFVCDILSKLSKFRPSAQLGSVACMLGSACSVVHPGHSGPAQFRWAAQSAAWAQFAPPSWAAWPGTLSVITALGTAHFYWIYDNR